MSDFNDVGDFHAKFGLPVQNDEVAPHELDAAASDLRIKRLQEELDEYILAVKEGDLPGQFDALIDLVYIAHGTAHMHSFPWIAGWNEVQRANITKARAAADGSDSKYGSSLDIVKPAGWKPPDIKAVLQAYGYWSKEWTPRPTKRIRTRRYWAHVALPRGFRIGELLTAIESKISWHESTGDSSCITGELETPCDEYTETWCIAATYGPVKGNSPSDMRDLIYVLVNQMGYALSKTSVVIHDDTDV